MRSRSATALRWAQRVDEAFGVAYVERMAA
jgi:hypothetical protein